MSKAANTNYWGTLSKYFSLQRSEKKEVSEPTKTNEVTKVEPPKQEVIQPVYKVVRKDSCNDSTLNQQDPYLFELLDILSIKRRDKTQTELLFCEAYLTTIKTPRGELSFEKKLSPSGELLAYVLEVSDAPVLWSCHVDSVHNQAGYVQLSYDSVLQSAFVSDKSSPLGADDAAGMWLLFQMIRAGVGGTYIFHKAEEVGGVGSFGMKTHHEEFLKKFDFAIAFDRKANTSVITHQGGKRCCSDAFADSFIAAMKTQFLPYVKDNGGVFTDTKNYISIIPECTNISCGYMYEHTSSETLDVGHLINLKDALIAVCKDGIPFVKERDPKAVEFKPTQTWSGNKGYPKAKGGFSGVTNMFDDVDISGYENDPFWSLERSTYYPAKPSTKSRAMINEKTLPSVFFKIHKQGVAYVNEMEVLEDPDYLGYEEKILDEICKLEKMNFQQMRNYLTSSDLDPKIAACVIRKLLWEARF